MSTKRILGITVFGLLLIAAAIGAMLLMPFLRNDGAAIVLPDTPLPIDSPHDAQPDALDRVEVNKYTVQAIISTLERPDTYSREIVIESFWEDGQATWVVDVSVTEGITSLSVSPPVGPDKKIIVTPTALYIWHVGDRSMFIGSPDSSGDLYRIADEWQMLFTYESILELDINDIVNADFTEIDDQLSVFVLYHSPMLNNVRTYYISLELGLILSVVEYDSSGMLIYRMTAGETFIGEITPEAFTLLDGTSLI